MPVSKSQETANGPVVVSRPTKAPAVRTPSASPSFPLYAYSMLTATSIELQSQRLPLTPRVAFCIFFASHVIAAIYSPIQDCDEVFNYWEPTHYLNHGHGFQTWEYSPEYAIRSWAYTLLHALITPFARLLTFVPSTKPYEFYLLRIFLGFVCARCETRLFAKISNIMNSRIGILYLIITASSPGNYHASVAFLPSSFAMYFVVLGMAAFMDWHGGLRTAEAIFCFGVGACIGWPFAIAMAAPFLLEELVLASVGSSHSMRQLFWRVVDGVVRTLIVLSGQIAIDAFFYRKLVLVPFNIVRYNVFSSKGPDLYGTEPWHFYLRNLFLNFHVWLLLALASLPLLIMQQSRRVKGATRSSKMRDLAFLTPFYLWLAIFTLQPHKEERFMYPAYPALALNAAFSTHVILANVGSIDQKGMISKIPVQLRLTAIVGFMLVAVAISAFRTIGTMTAFSAPLSIYQPLHRPGMTQPGDLVCLGKEWYRFPSHYLLPEGVRAKFVRSEFRGLLPGEFSEAKQGFGLFPGTWLIPPGMNDENQEDIGKYTDVKSCDFLVDLNMPSTIATKIEPNYIAKEQQWEKVRCLPYLDAASSGSYGRLGWTPSLPFMPSQFQRIYGDYCLLKRKTKQTPMDNRQRMPNIEILL